MNFGWSARWHRTIVLGYLEPAGPATIYFACPKHRSTSSPHRDFLHQKALGLAIRGGAGRNHTAAGIEAIVPLRIVKARVFRTIWSIGSARSSRSGRRFG